MDKLKMHSPNLVANNIEKLAQLFPNCVTEAKDEKNGKTKLAIDFDQLRQELADHVVEGPRERYHLNWPGKSEALMMANSPTLKALRPYRDESIDFDTTKNLFIEGDNLDAMKILQESYLGKIKMIYIDPPYNTGKDFIYRDNFTQDLSSYLQQSDQRDESGNRLVQNTESNGRFHSDWLSMLYPRLKLAQRLLKDDGAIFISIGDDEVSNLRKICDEIFGGKNYVGTFVWRRRAPSALAERLISTDHEYVVVYQKNDFVSLGVPKTFENYSNPDNDPRGDWLADNLTVGMNKDLRPNQYYPLVDPRTGLSYPANPNRVWAYIPESMNKLIQEGRIIFPSDPSRRPMLKRFKSELKTLVNPVSTWAEEVGLNSEATRELQDLFGLNPFEYSKPISLLNFLIKCALNKGDLFLDFFAGSGTSAQAIMELNSEDGGERRFILIQMPEPTNRGQFSTVAEICKTRLRLAGKRIKAERPLASHTLDIGFRVLKVDNPSFANVLRTPEETQQRQLEVFSTNIEQDRTPEDLLFQVLADWALDLSLSIEAKTICDKKVFFVDENALAACFDADVPEELLKALALRRVENLPLQKVVFRDSSFPTDSSKINVEQIFKLLSPGTEVRII